MVTTTPRSAPAACSAAVAAESSPLDPTVSLMSLSPGPAVLRAEARARAPPGPIEFPEMSISITAEPSPALHAVGGRNTYETYCVFHTKIHSNSLKGRELSHVH